MTRIGRSGTCTSGLLAGAALVMASYGCSIDTDGLTGGGDSGARDAAGEGSDATTSPAPAEDGGALDGGALHDGESGTGLPAADGIIDTACAPKSCAAQQIDCGDAGDGCGRQLDCGSCHKYGDVCVDGKCGCTPKTAAKDCGALCGKVPDGCAGFYDCGLCQGTDVYCGPANTCVSGTTCPGSPDYQNACGVISDGCGSTRESQNGSNCPTTDVNEGCNAGPIPYSCGCFPSSCAQQGFACSAPGSKPVGDLCQDPNLTCSGCTYPPGQCSASHQCASCTRVAAPAYPWDTQCQETALPEAWACDCVDGGTCVVPDGASADGGSPPTCVALTSTDAHAIYCCKAQD